MLWRELTGTDSQHLQRGTADDSPPSGGIGGSTRRQKIDLPGLTLTIADERSAAPLDGLANFGDATRRPIRLGPLGARGTPQGQQRGPHDRPPAADWSPAAIRLTHHGIAP